MTNETERSRQAQAELDKPVEVLHVVRGELVRGNEVHHSSRDLGVNFTTPRINMDQLITPRSEPGPLFDVKLSDIIDFLVETGERLDPKRNPHLEECIDHIAKTNPLPRRVIENLSRKPDFITKSGLMAQVEANFFDPAFLDGWVPRTDEDGQRVFIRAYPPRLIHMLAGNAPGAAMASIAQGALVKAINVFKMPSSDPFSAVAVLRTMADVDPDHPVVRSMSAVYWSGGDRSIENVVYRPQFFDKIVAWGGGEAINNAAKYVGPGLQLVSFDPKSSISMIGAEALESDSVMDEVVEKAAIDVTPFNQEACNATRFIFIEGDNAQVDQFCEKLLPRLAVDRPLASARAMPLPNDIRDEIEVMNAMGGSYKTWGKPDGSGMVIRSEEPVGFHPSNKTSNVIRVNSLAEAVEHVNVATQTVSVYPDERKQELRNSLASAGAQRIVRLGSASKHMPGTPHDAMYPLQRYVNWISDEEL